MWGVAYVAHLVVCVAELAFTSIKSETQNAAHVSECEKKNNGVVAFLNVLLTD